MSRGPRLLLTRAADDCVAWAEALRALGAEPVAFPCIEVEPVPGARDALRAALPDATWVIATSRRGVDALVGLEVPPHAKVAVVGPSTAERAVEVLGHVDLVAPEATAASLAGALATLLTATDRLVAPLSSRAGDALDILPGLQRIDAYRTVAASPSPSPLDLSPYDLDHALLASPSAAEGLAHRALASSIPGVLSIGPSTTATAEALGLRVVGEARTRDLPGLLAARPEPRP